MTLSQPEYHVIRKTRGERGGPEMVICTLTDAETEFKYVGAARVFSLGVQDACDRAYAQAMGKVGAAS